MTYEEQYEQETGEKAAYYEAQVYGNVYTEEFIAWLKSQLPKAFEAGREKLNPLCKEWIFNPNKYKNYKYWEESR